jgi:hypothetical protein
LKSICIESIGDMKIVICVLLVAGPGTVMARDPMNTIKGRFEDSRNVRVFEYDSLQLSQGISYFSSSVGGVRRYEINIEGECGGLQLYKSGKAPNEIILDASCQGQGSQIHQYIYKWDNKFKDWCLREELTGERADSTSASEGQTFVDKIKGCTPLGSN